jgi:RNA recognition motif-containing protein
VPFKTKPDKLKKLFRPYGKIEAIYKRSLLQKTEKLTLKMFGTDEELKKTVTDAHIYVRYENEEDAKKAVEL